jgi:peptidylprolyl isomerase
VAQWGHNDDRPLPAGIVAKPPAEYERPAAALKIRPFPYRDVFASRAGYVGPWTVAVDKGQATLNHCYGTVGVGRDLAPDTGTGGELYAIIGGPARALDRNIAIVGRVISGIETMSALPRGTEALGFYKERSSDVPIRVGRIASDLPPAERPRFEVLDTTSPTFTAWLSARANRKDDFYTRPAGAIDLCSAQPPVRPAKT